MLPSRQALTMAVPTVLWRSVGVGARIIPQCLHPLWLHSLWLCFLLWPHTHSETCSCTSYHGRAKASDRPPWRPHCKRQTRSVWPSSWPRRWTNPNPGPNPDPNPDPNPEPPDPNPDPNLDPAVSLSTQEERNVTFYRRFGFAVIADEICQVGATYRSWTMLREPKPVGEQHGEQRAG